MRFRLAIATFLACLVATAQTMTIDQLVSFMRSAIKNKQPDKDVAAYVSRQKLSQKLEDSVIEELQTEGLGPRTVSALRGLASASSSQPVAVLKKVEPPPPPAEEPPPPPGQQKKIIEDAREYALNYSKNLPNFICAQNTKRYDNGRMYDNVLARLTYYEQHEKYDTISINDQMSNKAYDKLDGSISTGEFGSMLMGLFDPQTQAEFKWSAWKMVGPRKTYVFKFYVDQPHSRWEIEDRQANVKIMPAYEGFVWIDVKDNSVVEFYMNAVDMPGTFSIKEANTRLHYDTVAISGIPHMLPARATMHMLSGRDDQKNEITFHNYQKYTADAVLKTDFEDPPSDDKDKKKQ